MSIHVAWGRRCGGMWMRWMWVLGLALPMPCPGQSALEGTLGVRIVEFGADPELPEFGRPFDLEVVLRVPPGVVVLLPDTLIGREGAESSATGQWSRAPGPGDSLEVRASYPVLPLLTGRVELPWMELGVRLTTEGEAAGVLGPGEGAGFEGAVGDRFTSVLIPIGATEVSPHLELEGAGGKPSARPVADVLGGEWSAWAVAAVVVLLGVVAWSIWVTVAKVGRARREIAGTGTRPLPRADALHELERIRKEGWHRNGRIPDFYAATTGVLRGFAARREPAWSTALTSSELLSRMRNRWSEGIGPVDRAVIVAERVKFGGDRPEPDVAEAHWREVYRWIESRPEDR